MYRSLEKEKKISKSHRKILIADAFRRKQFSSRVSDGSSDLCAPKYNYTLKSNFMFMGDTRTTKDTLELLPMSLENETAVKAPAHPLMSFEFGFETGTEAVAGSGDGDGNGVETGFIFFSY